MAVRIRLSRWGAKRRPYYKVVVANSTAPRDGKFIEKVGTYNPLLDSTDKNRVVLKLDRINYWINNGALPTERVAKFISAAGGVLPAACQKKIVSKSTHTSNLG